MAMKKQEDSDSSDQEIEDNDDYYTKLNQEEDEILKNSSPMK